MPSRIANWFDNVGTPTNNYVVGPFPLGDVSKLLAVRVSGSIAFDPQGISTTTEIAIAGILGVHVVVSGDPPLNLPADQEDSRFLAIKAFDFTAGTATWAPSTSTAGYLAIGGWDLSYSGQHFYGGGLDLYVNSQSTFTSAVAWATTGWFEAILS